MEPNAPKLILVPTDFSAPSAQALRYGAALAERYSAHLLVIYADSFVPPVDYTIGAAGVFDLPRQELVDAAQEQLQAFAETNIPPAVPYDVRVLVAAPIHAIVAQTFETGADLIVMGTHGRTGLSRLLVGSVTEAVMRLAPVPVIVVRELTKETAVARRVVGCVMPARECRVALRYANVLIDEGAHFVLYGGAAGVDRPFTMDDLNLLQVCTPAEILAHTSFRFVEPLGAEDVLADAEASRADLIVLGIPAERSFAEALRGTMAERVVQQSTCPVLTINHFAAARIASAGTGGAIHELEPALSA